MTPSAWDPAQIWLGRWLALATLSLVAATRRLWTGSSELPLIPWSDWLTRVPPATDPVLTGGLIVTVIVTIIMPARAELMRALSRAVWFWLSALLVLDQHRLQPWAWQFWLLWTVLSLADARVAIRCARALVVSVYFWSAVSKLDPGFVTGHGQMLLDGLLQCCGLNGRIRAGAGREFAAGCMPAGELLTALLLFRPAWRRWGLALSIVMHLLLLLATGPWGLGHEPGVQLWNLYFIGQNLLLFARSSVVANAVGGPEVATRRGIAGNRTAFAVTAAACAAPLLNPLGLWDHWPSWSVYSAHPEIVRLEVDESVVERLPARLKRLTGPPRPLESWRPVGLDQWSFAEASAPPYPQARWKVAVALAVLERAGIDGEGRVVIESRIGWWNPGRDRIVLRGRDEIRQALASCLFSTRSR